MIEIAKMGFAATCEKHCAGDKQKLLTKLLARALRVIDGPQPYNNAWQNFNGGNDDA